ncbi:hypothetical protein [Shewanella psychrophila]|uniref:hypothetical protein n=1 Tax=Shewanella psychrophila TaxID=225848 RepID=UPI0011EA5AB2|nr:hypothetical protein [Shewanella psychrophila]
MQSLYLNHVQPNRLGHTFPVSSSQYAALLAASSSVSSSTSSLSEDSVSISDLASKFLNGESAFDKGIQQMNGSTNSRAIGAYMAEQLYELNANKLKDTRVKDEDEGLSMIDKQIKRIQKQLQKLKEELRAISGENTENAKLERKIIQEQIMLLTVQIVSLLERKMRVADV